MSNDNADIGNIDALIEDLTEDLNCMKPLPHPFCCLTIWMAVAIAYSAITIYFMGLRADILTKLQEPVFLLEIGLAATITVTAAAAALYARVPDSRGAGWLAAVPSSFLVIFALWSTIRFITEDAIIPEINWVHCATSSGMFIAIPLAALTFLSIRKCASTMPTTMLLMQAMAVGGLGYICLRLTCIMDTMGYSLVYHIAPFLVLGTLIGVVARRFYRW